MRTILVADDDSHIRDVICFALRRAGFEVIEAADGRATLDEFTRHRPDLVILDILMPELTGLDVCRAIRGTAEANPPQSRNVPILFLSSKDAEPDRVAGMDCLPPNLASRRYYEPGGEGFEREVRTRLNNLERLKKRRLE